MWTRSSGKKSKATDDLVQGSRRRREDDDNDNDRNPSHGPVSTTSQSAKQRSSVGRAEDRDRGFEPSSTAYSSTSQSAFPQTAGASVASSDATAYNSGHERTYNAPELVRNQSLTEKMPRSEPSRGDSEGEADGSRSSKSRKNGKRSRKDSAKSQRSSRSVDGASGVGGNSRGPEDTGASAGSGVFQQFPGQVDGGVFGSQTPSSAAHHDMSSHVPDQFPGQFPSEAAEPYRPPLAANEGGPGLASDYYGDAGQSVADQPGFRMHSPSLIVGLEPHLQAASMAPAPPQEPSASGGVGAAASFYGGGFESDEGGSTVTHQVSTTSTSAPSRPEQAQASSSNLPTVGSAALGAAAGYMVGSQSSQYNQSQTFVSSTSQTQHASSSIQQPPSQSAASFYSTTGGPSQSGRPSPPSSTLPLYAAGAAGAAGLAAAAMHHEHHQSTSHGSDYQQSSNPMASRRRRTNGPLGAFVNFFRDPEGVAQYEEYTEFIGVCRNCFDPGSSPRDAPRKHHYRRRRSDERIGKTSKVEKSSRYSSDDEKGRSNDKSWVATGLAGYGIGKMGESLLKKTKDFDDTYSVKSGRYSPEGHKKKSRKASESDLRKNKASRDDIQIGIINDGKSHIESRKSRRKSRSRSRSRDRKSSVTAAALGAVAGASISEAQRPHHSSSQYSHSRPSERRTKSHRRKKKDKGFFSFLSSSSSSSSLDLDYSRISKGSKSKDRDEKKAKAALVGLGAAAAALAAADGRSTHDKKGVKALVGVKESGPRYKPPTAEEAEWVDESDAGSVDSGLAFGADSPPSSPTSHSSSASISRARDRQRRSEMSGKGTIPRRRTSQESIAFKDGVPSNSNVADPALLFQDRSQETERRRSSPTLRNVFPVSTSDPGRFDVAVENSVPARPVVAHQRDDIPLQQPKPIVPVSKSFYSSTVDAISPKRSSTFSETTIQRNHPETRLADDRSDFNASSRDFTLRRRDTSPATFGTDPKLDEIKLRRKTASKDDSVVRFDLPDYDDRERREKRRRRREDGDSERRDRSDRRDGRKDSVTSEPPPKDDFERRSAEASSRKDSEVDSNNTAWTTGAVVGLAGAAVGAAALLDRDREESREERRERRRREKRRDEEADEARAERRRRKRFEEREGSPEGEIDGKIDDRKVMDRERQKENRRNERDADEHPVTSQEDRETVADARNEHDEAAGSSTKKGMSVWQEAASSNQHPTHEDYGSFFTPVELLNRSDDDRQVPDANADADMEYGPGASIVTVAPRRSRDLSASPEFSAADRDYQIHPSKVKLPWAVPRLRLLFPTPPSSIESTPIIRPRERHQHQDDEVSDIDHSTHEDDRKDDRADRKETSQTTNRIPDENEEVALPKIERKPLSIDNEIPSAHGALQEDDYDFAATVAASAEEAGFDPSIIIDNASFHRRESPPNSKDRSLPDDSDDNETRPKKISRRKKARDSDPSDRSLDRDAEDVTIESESIEPSSSIKEEKLDELSKSKTEKSKRSKKSKRGSKNVPRGDELGDEQDVNDLRKPVTDASDPQKERPGNESSIFNDGVSTTSISSKGSDSTAPTTKSKSKGRSLWNRVLSKPDSGSSQSEETVKRKADDSVSDVRMTEKEGKDGEGSLAKGEDASPSKSIVEKSLPAGSVAQYLADDSDSEQTKEQVSQSFLGMRPEPPPPPDIQHRSEKHSQAPDLDSSKEINPVTEPGKISEVRITDSPQSPKSVASPTAVPVHFRRPGHSRGSSDRSLSQTEFPRIWPVEETPVRPKPRPRSTEFKSSKEIRPLWLVERHRSQQEPSPEETYPSLPSSRSTSHSTSPHNIRNHDEVHEEVEAVATDQTGCGIEVLPVRESNVSTQPEGPDSSQAISSDTTFPSPSDVHDEISDVPTQGQPLYGKPDGAAIHLLESQDMVSMPGGFGLSASTSTRSLGHDSGQKDSAEHLNQEAAFAIVQRMNDVGEPSNDTSAMPIKERDFSPEELPRDQVDHGSSIMKDAAKGAALGASASFVLHAISESEDGQRSERVAEGDKSISRDLESTSLAEDSELVSIGKTPATEDEAFMEFPSKKARKAKKGKKGKSSDVSEVVDDRDLPAEGSILETVDADTSQSQQTKEQFLTKGMSSDDIVNTMISSAQGPEEENISTGSYLPDLLDSQVETSLDKLNTKSRKEKGKKSELDEVPEAGLPPELERSLSLTDPIEQAQGVDMTSRSDHKDAVVNDEIDSVLQNDQGFSPAMMPLPDDKEDDWNEPSGVRNDERALTLERQGTQAPTEAPSGVSKTVVLGQQIPDKTSDSSDVMDQAEVPDSTTVEKSTKDASPERRSPIIETTLEDHADQSSSAEAHISRVLDESLVHEYVEGIGSPMTEPSEGLLARQLDRTTAQGAADGIDFIATGDQAKQSKAEDTAMRDPIEDESSNVQALKPSVSEVRTANQSGSLAEPVVGDSITNDELTMEDQDAKPDSVDEKDLAPQLDDQEFTSFTTKKKKGKKAKKGQVFDLSREEPSESMSPMTPEPQLEVREQQNEAIPDEFEVKSKKDKKGKKKKGSVKTDLPMMLEEPQAQLATDELESVQQERELADITHNDDRELERQDETEVQVQSIAGAETPGKTNEQRPVTDDFEWGSKSKKDKKKLKKTRTMTLDDDIQLPQDESILAKDDETLNDSIQPSEEQNQERSEATKATLLEEDVSKGENAEPEVWGPPMSKKDKKKAKKARTMTLDEEEANVDDAKAENIRSMTDPLEVLSIDPSTNVVMQDMQVAPEKGDDSIPIDLGDIQTPKSKKEKKKSKKKKNTLLWDDEPSEQSKDESSRSLELGGEEPSKQSSIENQPGDTVIQPSTIDDVAVSDLQDDANKMESIRADPIDGDRNLLEGNTSGHEPPSLLPSAGAVEESIAPNDALGIDHSAQTPSDSVQQPIVSHVSEDVSVQPDSMIERNDQQMSSDPVQQPIVSHVPEDVSVQPDSINERNEQQMSSDPVQESLVPHIPEDVSVKPGSTIERSDQPNVDGQLSPSTEPKGEEIRDRLDDLDDLDERATDAKDIPETSFSSFKSGKSRKEKKKAKKKFQSLLWGDEPANEPDEEFPSQVPPTQDSTVEQPISEAGDKQSVIIEKPSQQELVKEESVTNVPAVDPKTPDEVELPSQEMKESIDGPFSDPHPSHEPEVSPVRGPQDIPAALTFEDIIEPSEVIEPREKIDSLRETSPSVAIASVEEDQPPIESVIEPEDEFPIAKKNKKGKKGKKGKKESFDIPPNDVAEEKDQSLLGNQATSGLDHEEDVLIVEGHYAHEPEDRTDPHHDDQSFDAEDSKEKGPRKTVNIAAGSPEIIERPPSNFVGEVDHPNDLSGVSREDVDSKEPTTLDTPASIDSINMLDAKEQREYNEQYRMELERQLSPHGIKADDAIASQTSLSKEVSNESPVEAPQEPIPTPTGLTSSPNDAEIRPDDPSLAATPSNIDSEVEKAGFTMKPSKKGKKSKKSKKQQTVIWEDETATRGVEEESEPMPSSHTEPERSVDTLDQADQPVTNVVQPGPPMGQITSTIMEDVVTGAQKGKPEDRLGMSLSGDTIQESMDETSYPLQQQSREENFLDTRPTSEPQVLDQSSTKKGSESGLGDLASAATIGVGMVAAEEIVRKGSKKGKKKGKTSKKAGRSASPVYDESSRRSDSVERSAERDSPATEDTMLGQFETSPPKSPFRSRSRSPLPSHQDIVHQEPIERTRSPILSERPDVIREGEQLAHQKGKIGAPENRDSAIHVIDSPILPDSEQTRHPHRDSGYPETEGSLSADKEVNVETEIIDSYEEPDRDQAEQDIIDSYSDVGEQGPGSGLDRARSPSEVVLGKRRDSSASDEANHDSSQTPPQKSRRKHRRRKSDSDYNSDDSNDSGFDVQRRRRRQAVLEQEPREPSPVNSTTKDRSSALFDSSPSARQILYESNPGISQGPRQESLHSDSLSSREPVIHGEEPHESIVKPKDNDPAPHSSIFGGPSHEESPTPPRSPVGDDVRGRHRLTRISENSLEDYPLAGKGKKRSSATRSSSNQSGRAGRSSQQEKSPPTLPAVGAAAVVAAAAGGASIKELRHLRDASGDESRKSSDIERSRSRERDHRRRMSNQSNNSAMHRDADWRRQAVGTPDSIHAIIRTPDQMRSSSGQSIRSSGTPPLRRVDRSVSSDLRGASKIEEAKARAKSEAESEPELPNLVIPSSSTYDPLVDKGKNRGDMADVYVSSPHFSSCLS